MLIPLHVKSYYSLGLGTTPISKLVERAAALALPAMALTDVENLYGQVVFHRLAREKGLRPITGVELIGGTISQGAENKGKRGGKRESTTRRAEGAEKTGARDERRTRRDRLVLLTRNRAGYESLCRIITRRKLARMTLKPPVCHDAVCHDAVCHDTRGQNAEGAANPDVEDPLESIRAESTRAPLEGLFILLESPSALERALALPGVDHAQVRLLLVRPGRTVTAEAAVREASARLRVPLIADPDIVFLDPGDRPLHQLQVAITENALVSRLEKGGAFSAGGRHFPGPRECASLFRDVPDAVEETLRIAEACTLDLSKAKPIFPRITLPDGETAYSHLAKTAFRGLERRFGRIDARHLERLTRELQVIDELGFSEYFLVVGDIIRFARERGIEVVGRGSGAGSLVAHVLGVTNVDPIEHGLYFERFLHPGRSDLPDIDIDLCWIRRDEVIDHVYRTYGADRVAMISSHVTFQPHMAFRETLKAFGVPLSEVNRCSRRIPYIYPEIRSKAPLRDLIASSALPGEIPLDEEPFRTAVPLAERLLHQPHHLSVHPGGIVIADREIDAYVPLEIAAKGIVVTQYDMYSVEDVGLVKIDLLGNRCLTEIQETLELAARAEAAGPESSPAESLTPETPRASIAPSLRLAEIPDADPKAVEILREGRTVGCFQLESPAMRSLLAKIRPQGIRDCIAAVAIIRPGAAAGGAKEAFVRRRSGEEAPEYRHPSLRRILEESHGIVIYEEDVMCIASAIAGLSLAEGDRLRSALKKLRHPDDVRDLENDFLRRAVGNGVEPDVAQAVWKDLRKFAAYCFSKAHAAGYGVLAYQAAYLKAHFPVEFACALLNNHAGMYSTRTIAEEVKRMGVRLLHPSVNRSEIRFTVEHGSGEAPGSKESRPERAVRTGLGRVKGLSQVSMDALLEARRACGPFHGLADFLRRVSAPRREVEALVLAGAFDDLPLPSQRRERPNHPQLIWELESLMPSSLKAHGSPNKISLCRATASQEGWLALEEDWPDYPPLKPYDPLVRVSNELRILEMVIAEHPMRLLREEASRRGAIPTTEAARQIGKRVRVAGLLAATRKIRTSRGAWMQFLTIEDEHGLLEATLFPRAFQAFSARVRTLGPYLVEGVIEEDHRALNLNVSCLEALSSSRAKSMRPVWPAWSLPEDGGPFQEPGY